MIEIKQSVKVFYDGGGTLFNYLRTDIDFVQFVRSPQEADVHIQINSITTGNGGKNTRFFSWGQRSLKELKILWLHLLPHCCPIVSGFYNL
ncbi:MAG: hypothetical protein U5K00_16020 [Melioribacteraceae bacterium]|nr:hypothetical protein [Melioribacteraceae bacterium]